MKKKVWILVAAFALVVLLVLWFVNNNHENSHSNSDLSKSVNSEEYFVWNVLDDTVIEGYTELGLKQTELVIPAKCKSVMGLEENTTVKKIIFENPDTYIYSYTFAKCNALETVELPANLTELESGVFRNCKNLKSIDIPDSVTTISDNVFLECSSLKSVTLPEGLEVIGREAFSDCTSLKSIVIPDSVTSIEKSAFERCRALESVEFGKGIITIGDSAFEMCDSLKSVLLYEGVTTLGSSAFGLCKSIEEIHLPASIKSIESDSIQQTHKTKVFVAKGSYMENRILELLGADLFDVEVY